jgi:hypothetical protein
VSERQVNVFEGVGEYPSNSTLFFGRVSLSKYGQTMTFRAHPTPTMASTRCWTFQSEEGGGETSGTVMWRTSLMSRRSDASTAPRQSPLLKFHTLGPVTKSERGGGYSTSPVAVAYGDDAVVAEAAHGGDARTVLELDTRVKDFVRVLRGAEVGCGNFEGGGGGGGALAGPLRGAVWRRRRNCRQRLTRRSERSSRP